jgi:hypothetical protein
LGGQANQVAVFAIADHEPLPQEAIEHTVYLSNNPNATVVGSDGNTQWVLATLKKVYLEGWRSDWITDGFTAVWQLPNGQAFRYAKVTAGGPTALQSDGDDEIDAVMGLNALGQSVQQPQVFKCPLSQGYWKNHASAWPVQSLSLGGKSYTKAEAIALLNTPVKGDASLILAYQLIAAKVNIANGADPTPAQSAVATGDTLFSQFSGKLPYNVKSSSTTGVAMTNTGSVLDGYNTGQLTSSCKP